MDTGRDTDRDDTDRNKNTVNEVLTNSPMFHKKYTNNSIHFFSTKEITAKIT